MLIQNEKKPCNLSTTFKNSTSLNNLTHARWLQPFLSLSPYSPYFQLITFSPWEKLEKLNEKSCFLLFFAIIQKFKWIVLTIGNHWNKKVSVNLKIILFFYDIILILLLILRIGNFNKILQYNLLFYMYEKIHIIYVISNWNNWNLKFYFNLSKVRWMKYFWFYLLINTISQVNIWILSWCTYKQN